MSQENVEIVRQIWALIAQGANEVSFEFTAPDFEWDLSAADGPYSGVYTRAEAQRVAREFTDTWAAMDQEPLEFIAAGDQVVTPFAIRTRGRSGIEVAAEGTYVWTIRDGLVTRLRLYQDRAEALEAVGLSE